MTTTPPSVDPSVIDPHGRYTLLFDADCPFCRLEVDWLLKRKRAKLAVANIAEAGFDPAHYGLTRHDVESQLHGFRADGVVTVGMESVRASYDAAGVGWLMAWTRWPLLRWFSDLGYRLFARYRVPLGRLVGRSCEDGTCSVPAPRPEK